jgi:hypothetical protein
VKRLPASFSIFSAEAAALGEALKFIVNRNSPGPWLICTDSKSLLHHLAHPKSTDSKNYLITEVRLLLEKLTNQRVTVNLLWTPSHIGLPGNERADTLAKLSCAAPLQQGIDTPVTDIARLIAHDTAILWDTNWRLRSATKGSEHAKLFPDGHLPRRPWFYTFPSRQRGFYTALGRLRFAHVLTPERLFAWNLCPSPACPCSFSPASLHHLLFDCPRHNVARLPLTACLSALNIRPPYHLPHLLISKNFTIYQALHELYIAVFPRR